MRGQSGGVGFSFHGASGEEKKERKILRFLRIVNAIRNYCSAGACIVKARERGARARRPGLFTF